jgi:photosystem II stability/assembly factor-like uncharacterized protein
MKLNISAGIIIGFLSICVNPTRAQWVQTNGPYSGEVHAFASSGTTLYAGTLWGAAAGVGGGVFCSTDNGAHWIPVGGEIMGHQIYSLAARGPVVYAGTEKGGVYRSTNNGITWTLANIAPPNATGWANTEALAFAGNYIFAGAYPGSIFRSGDDGAHWTEVATGLPGGTVVKSIVVADTNIFIAGAGIYRANLNGSQWTAVNTGITQSETAYSLAISGSVLYAASLNGVFRSSNNGTSWTNIGAPYSWLNFTKLAASDSDLYLVQEDAGAFKYNENEKVWKDINTGLTNLFPFAITVSGSTVVVGTWDGIFQSFDKGSHWNAINNGLTNSNITTLAASGTNLFAGTFHQGVFRSTNDGASWARITEGASLDGVRDLKISGATIFALGWNDVYGSRDNGGTWAKIEIQSGYFWAHALAVSGTTWFAGGEIWEEAHQLGGIYRSTDNGLTWSKMFSGDGNNIIESMIIIGSDVYAIGDQYLIRSTDNGVTWKIAANGMIVLPGRLAVSGSSLIICTPVSIFRSDDNAVTWKPIVAGLPPNPWVDVLAVVGTKIIVSISGSGSFLSTDNGEHWVNIGSTLSPITAFAASGSNVFAGSAQHGVWKRPVSELVTGVHPNATQSPLSFDLEQNYPNPFNPSTTIAFSLPSRAFVTLKIFDVMGRDVATVVSEELHAGPYSRSWDATGYPSGVYFYRLQAGAYTETKRLILLR